MKGEFELAKEHGVSTFATTLLKIIEFLECRGAKVEADFDVEETIALVASSNDAQAISLMVRDGIVSVGREVLKNEEDPRFLFRAAEIIKAYAEYVEALRCVDPLIPPELDKELAGKILN